MQVYLPDMKYALAETDLEFSRAADYPQRAKAAILEMFRQTGPVQLEGGQIKRGVLIRHLVLPGHLENTRRVMDWVAETFQPGAVLFSLMRQYTPQPGAVGPMARRVTAGESRAALRYMDACGITAGFTQGAASAQGAYVPDFFPEGMR